MAAEPLDFGATTVVAEGLRRTASECGRAERWELHNPDRRNAVTPAALRWMEARCAELEGQVVLLTSSEGPYCSGFDLKALQQALAEAGPGMPDQVLISATSAMRRANAVFIAAARKYAIGAGVELLACCDLRVMSEASFIEVPAARLGVVYHAAGIQRFREVFGGQIATRLLAVADRVPARDLLNAGALSSVEPLDQVQARAEAMAAGIVGLDASAVRHNLALLRAADDGRLDADTLAKHEQARAIAYGRVGRAATAGSETPLS